MHLVLAGQVLREDVRWVDVTPDFPHLDCSSANFLLDPQGVSFQVPQFPNPDLVEMPRATLESVHTLTGVSWPESFMMDW